MSEDNIVCANSICNNRATMHVGIKLKVRKICIDCYDMYFRGGFPMPLLRKLNPQESLGSKEYYIDSIT